MWLFIRPRHLEVKGRRRTTALLTASFIRLDPTCPKQALLPRWLNKPWAILRRCSKRWPAYKDGQREREAVDWRSTEKLTALQRRPLRLPALYLSPRGPQHLRTRLPSRNWWRRFRDWTQKKQWLPPKPPICSYFRRTRESALGSVGFCSDWDRQRCRSATTVSDDTLS